MKTDFTFGVDYYPEHWPRQRWETDAAMMQKLGIQVVRMGEFSWHKMEPVDGEYHFEWLDEVLEILEKQGIRAILGTPSAALPQGVEVAFRESEEESFAFLLNHQGAEKEIVLPAGWDPILGEGQVMPGYGVMVLARKKA